MTNTVTTEASLVGENDLRLATEELGAQWGARDSVLKPLIKIRTKLQARQGSLKTQRKSNEERIRTLLAANKAIDIENQLIESDLEKFDF